MSTARAGVVLACVVWGWALLPERPRVEACAHPELRAPAVVVCGTGSARLAGPARRLFGLPVDPNRADAVTLESLPGIGPARARAILAERARRPFASIAELERVRGLGPARVAALAELVGIGDALAGTDGPSVDSSTCRSSCGNVPACGASAGGCPERTEEGP